MRRMPRRIPLRAGVGTGMRGATALRVVLRTRGSVVGTHAGAADGRATTTGTHAVAALRAGVGTRSETALSVGAADGRRLQLL